MFTAVLVIAIVELLVIVVGGLKVGRKKYDGSMIVTDTETKKTFSLEIDADPNTLDAKKQIVLKVTTLSNS